MRAGRESFAFQIRVKLLVRFFVDVAAKINVNALRGKASIQNSGRFKRTANRLKSARPSVSGGLTAVGVVSRGTGSCLVLQAAMATISNAVLMGRTLR